MKQPAAYEERPCRYFTKFGSVNTGAVLDAVNRRAKELAIGKVVLATNTGKTANEALRFLDPDLKIIAVSRVTGFKEANIQELTETDRRTLQEKGVAVVTAAHAFGGVGRAVRYKFNTYQVDEVMAQTLKLFGRGTKVAIEVTLMATDAGHCRTDEKVIAIGGSGGGADTALVLTPSTSARFFDLRVHEVVCKPADPD